MTGPDESKRPARRVLTEIYEQGNLELAAALFDPELVDHEPTHDDLPIGVDSVAQTVRASTRRSASRG